MINKIAILLPTRQRLSDFKVFAESWKKYTEGKSVVILRIDDDDETYDEILKEYPEFVVEKGPRAPFLELLNSLAIKYSEQYNYVSFFEDDYVVKTNFETAFIEEMNKIGQNAIVWGNDLLNGGSIVGCPFMDSSIVRRLGFMTPPQIKFLFADHFWIELGRNLNSLKYMPEIIIQHLHYITNLRSKDSISEEVDEKGKQDYYNYHGYMSSEFNQDLAKLR